MFFTIPQLLFEKAKSIPNYSAQFYKDSTKRFQSVTYIELFQNVLYFGAGLLSLGTEKGEHIGLISDNRKEWFVSSLAVMTIGCADIPRGSEATVKDLEYILKFAECKTVIAENSFAYNKIIECKENLPELKNIILIDSKNIPDTNFSEKDKNREDKDAEKNILEKSRINIFTFEQILESGKTFRKENPGVVEHILEEGKGEDTATIIFTSGTTGTPKGVELTHKNFLCQVESLSLLLPLKKGDKSLSVLPVWHVYEREVEYYLMYIGAAICYSKPIVSMILDDMKKISPQFMACVPRVWEAISKQIEKQCVGKSKRDFVRFKTSINASVSIRKMNDLILGRNQRFKKRNFFASVFIKFLYIPIFVLLPFKSDGKKFYSKAKEIFGGNFKLGMSGGGGLAPKIDLFFNSIGITLVEGYGLTETAPICCIRNPKKPVLGTIGKVLPYCQGKVVSLSGKNCLPGEKGVLYIKGENVMKGYYRQPELTSQFIQDGWFNTGDLVIQTISGEIIVRGRAKDTIVLRSGENVEPFPIECKLAESPYIAQAVIVGNEQNSLGALIIPAKDKILEFAEENGITNRNAKENNADNFSAIIKDAKIKELIFKEFERLITQKNGFKHFEKIGKFVFLEKPFEVGVELSAKQDIVRYKINEIYKKQISAMFQDSPSLVQNLTQNLTQNIQNLTQNIQNLKEIIPAPTELLNRLKKK